MLVDESLEDQASISELTKHSTARMAGRSGREAKAKHLTLFHTPNDHREEEFLREATKKYGSKVTLATDLARI